MAGVPPIGVVVYGRPGCHLCDEALAALARIGRRIPLTVTSVNIDEDDELQRRYMFEIPVVVAAGQEVGRAPISEGALEDAIAALTVAP